jgi:site-specific recombinase
MLGMAPAIGQFLGLPIDVRHCHPEFRHPDAGRHLVGQKWFGEGAFLLGSARGGAIMFVLNLSVSFLLALATAVRAYELPAQDNAAASARTVSSVQGIPARLLRPTPSQSAEG